MYLSDTCMYVIVHAHNHCYCTEYTWILVKILHSPTKNTHGKISDNQGTACDYDGGQHAVTYPPNTTSLLPYNVVVWPHLFKVLASTPCTHKQCVPVYHTRHSPHSSFYDLLNIACLPGQTNKVRNQTVKGAGNSLLCAYTSYKHLCWMTAAALRRSGQTMLVLVWLPKGTTHGFCALTDAARKVKQQPCRAPPAWWA